MASKQPDLQAVLQAIKEGKVVHNHNRGWVNRSSGGGVGYELMLLQRDGRIDIDDAAKTIVIK